MARHPVQHANMFFNCEKFIDMVSLSVRTNQRKVDRSDPVLISLCNSVVQNRSSTEL